MHVFNLIQEKDIKHNIDSSGGGGRTSSYTYKVDLSLKGIVELSIGDGRKTNGFGCSANPCIVTSSFTIK